MELISAVYKVFSTLSSIELMAIFSAVIAGVYFLHSLLIVPVPQQKEFSDDSHIMARVVAFLSKSPELQKEEVLKEVEIFENYSKTSMNKYNSPMLVLYSENSALSRLDRLKIDEYNKIRKTIFSNLFIERNANTPQVS